MLFPIIFFTVLGLVLYFWPRYLDAQNAKRKRLRSLRNKALTKARERAYSREDPFSKHG